MRKAEWLLKSFKMIKLFRNLKNDMFNMLAECCNKWIQNMCVVARKSCTYVLYSVVNNTTPLRLLLLASCTLTRSERRYWLRRGSRMIVRRENVECCSLVICNNSKHAEVDSLPESSIVTYNHAERCHTISIKDKTYDFKVPNGKEG